MDTHNNFWPVVIKGNVKICVQQNLSQMSTYVLLEQEDWFEDEMRFIRAFITPEMNAFDIGANHGVYALTMAKTIRDGRIWAFEPTSSPGSMLERSILINEFQDRITLVKAGLSDHDRKATITISLNSELNSLHSKGERKEEIELLALDPFVERNGIDCSVDFVKLDAEGEEIAILKGGQTFFSQQSPLVMFELKHGSEINHGLIDAFRDLGYGIYRLLPDMDILVDYTDDFSDGYLLNLFACKQDRADELSRRGLLTTTEAFMKNQLHVEENAWKEKIFELEFAKDFRSDWLGSDEQMHPDHRKALSAMLLAFDRSRGADQRVALLHEALNLFDGLPPPLDKHISVWLLKLNLLHHLGYRSHCVEMARRLSGIIPADLGAMPLPFMPPSDRFYGRRSNGPLGKWLSGQLNEFHEYRKSFSSFFARDVSPNVNFNDQAADKDFELERRAVLRQGRYGSKPHLPASHPLLISSSSANREIWQSITAKEQAA